jgi:hypothetical protein
MTERDETCQIRQSESIHLKKGKLRVMSSLVEGSNPTPRTIMLKELEKLQNVIDLIGLSISFFQT